MTLFDVSIVGEINLDLIFYGLPKEMPVERELLATDFEVTLGSSSAILAHNLASLGLATGFTTRIGQDEFGRIAIDRLAQSGVDLSNTGVTVLLQHGSERHILTYPGTMAVMSRSDLDIDYLASARHFHISSLFLQQRLQADLPTLFRELKVRGLTISLDTNDDPSDRWDGVLLELLPLIDILLPNKQELCRMTRQENVTGALNSLAGITPIIAVKCGSEGAIVQVGNNRTSVPALSVTPVDTIGAGDSFNAGFLGAWLSGCSPEESTRAGNITAALSTQWPGGTEAFRVPGQRDKFLKDHNFPLIQHRDERGVPEHLGRRMAG